MQFELSYENVGRFLRYDPDAGKFFWQPRTPDMFEDSKVTREGSCRAWNTKHAGKEATIYQYDSRPATVLLCGKQYTANKIACLLKTGHWPKHHIRHMDGDKSNLRWSNLCLSLQEKVLVRDLPPIGLGPQIEAFWRTRNVLPLDETNPHKGVSWHKSNRCWQAYISINNKRVHIGNFIDLNEAIAARKKAEDDKVKKQQDVLNEKLARKMGIWLEG